MNTELGQGSLFEDVDLQKLQDEIKNNYSEVFKKKSIVFVEEPEEEFTDYAEIEVKCKGVIESDLFNVGEVEKINSDIQAQKLEKAVREARKTMDLPWFDNPQTHTEKLLNYQYLYLKNDDAEAYAKLLELAFKVCKFLVWKYLKTNKNIFLDEISQDEKASIAMEYVLRRYKYNIGWYVRTNFVGALKGGVLHAMTYENTTDKNTFYVEEPLLERDKNTKKKSNK